MLATEVADFGNRTNDHMHQPELLARVINQMSEQGYFKSEPKVRARDKQQIRASPLWELLWRNNASSTLGAAPLVPTKQQQCPIKGHCLFNGSRLKGNGFQIEVHVIVGIHHGRDHSGNWEYVKLRNTDEVIVCGEFLVAMHSIIDGFTNVVVTQLTVCVDCC